METWCAPSVKLGDVENTSIASLWIAIFRHLDWKDIVAGRSVCKTFHKELPSLIAQLRLRAFASATQRCMQLSTVAATFASLRSLELVRPTSIAAEAAPNLLNLHTVYFPVLEHLKVHVDVAGIIRLHADCLPALKTLLLVSDVRVMHRNGIPVTYTALTGCIWTGGAHRPVSTFAIGTQVYRL